MGREMTASELARSLEKQGELTISRAAVGKWLSGKTDNVRMNHLVELADLLRVDLRWLMVGQGEMRAKPGARPTLTADEQHLLAAFRALSDYFKPVLIEHLDRLASVPKPLI